MASSLLDKTKLKLSLVRDWFATAASFVVFTSVNRILAQLSRCYHTVTSIQCALRTMICLGIWLAFSSICLRSRSSFFKHLETRRLILTNTSARCWTLWMAREAPKTLLSGSVSAAASTWSTPTRSTPTTRSSPARCWWWMVYGVSSSDWNDWFLMICIEIYAVNWGKMAPNHTKVEFAVRGLKDSGHTFRRYHVQYLNPPKVMKSKPPKQPRLIVFRPGRAAALVLPGRCLRAGVLSAQN